MTEARTEAGRRYWLETEFDWEREAILAIEEEAAAAERERIRAAIPNIGYFWHQPHGVPDRDGFRTYSARQVDALLADPETP